MLIEGSLYIVGDALLLLMRPYFNFFNIKYAAIILLHIYGLKNVVEKVVLHCVLLVVCALDYFNIFFLPKIQCQIVFGREAHAFGLKFEVMVNRSFLNTYHRSRSSGCLILL
jgi:hypothetical protein